MNDLSKKQLDLGKILGRSLTPVTAISIIETFGDIREFSMWSQTLLSLWGSFRDFLFYPFSIVGIGFSNFQEGLVLTFCILFLCLRSGYFYFPTGFSEIKCDPYLEYLGKPIKRTWKKIDDGSKATSLVMLTMLFILLPYLFHYYGAGPYSSEMRVREFISTYIVAGSGVLATTALANVLFDAPFKLKMMKRVFRFNLKVIWALKDRSELFNQEFCRSEISRIVAENEIIRKVFELHKEGLLETRIRSLMVVGSTIGLFLAFSMVTRS